MVTPDDLRGVHVALATPLAKAGEAVDEAALARLVKHALDGGVDAVCVVGSTGEGPRLTRTARGEVTATVRGVVPKSHPIIASPAGLTADEVSAEIDDLAAVGADAVLVAAPSYYPMSAAEIARFYETLAARAPVPLIIYNIPVMTKVTVTPSTVGALAAHPNVVGIKDSSRDFEYLQAVLYATDGNDFAVLTGSDTMLLQSLVTGAVGTIAASANLVPHLSRSVYDSATSGDLGQAAAAQRDLFDVIQACRMGTPPAGWKAALSLAGVCSAATVPPAQPLPDSQLSALEARLKELGVL